jgi:hypothetical protein
MIESTPEDSLRSDLHSNSSKRTSAQCAPKRTSRTLRWTVVGAIATIAGTIVAIITLFGSPKDDAPRSPAPTTGPITQDQGCINLGTGNTCEITQAADEVSKNAADAAQLREAVARVSQGLPQGRPPWPFIVYDTRDGAGNDIGLKIKAEPSMGGAQIGSARGRSILWADCYVMNNFNPVSGRTRNDVGPKWLRIHWPTSEPGTSFRDASATDNFTGYAYAGYTLPFKHNGSISVCT